MDDVCWDEIFKEENRPSKMIFPITKDRGDARNKLKKMKKKINKRKNVHEQLKKEARKIKTSTVNY